MPSLPELPDWIDVHGNEDGGLTLACKRGPHGPNWKPIAGYFQTELTGLAMADNLTEFIRWIYAHVESHTLTERGERWLAQASNDAPAYKTTGQEKPVPGVAQMKEALNGMVRNR